MAAQLVGTWRLVRFEDVENGQTVYRHGEKPIGLFIYTAEGHVARAWNKTHHLDDLAAFQGDRINVGGLAAVLLPGALWTDIHETFLLLGCCMDLLAVAAEGWIMA